MTLLTTEPWVERALLRESRPEPIGPALAALANERVLITGGLGSLGMAVHDVLVDAGIESIPVDIDEMDVTDPVAVECVMTIFKPTVVLHLAGAKHAPEGEVDPLEPAAVHIRGTQYILASAAAIGARVVTASTCKACDPETAYGATKLIAERLTLNAGQSVARFHNVVETSGNVFETWSRTEGPLKYTLCSRYFITRAEAVSLLLYAATTRPGRYATHPLKPLLMKRIAERLYPGRELEEIAPRRGDRRSEPLTAACERFAPVGHRNIIRVSSPHDPEPPQPAEPAVAA